MSSHPEPGSKREFEIWYEKSGHQFLRLAYFYTRDPKLAEDIAQEATAKVWKAWPDDQKREKILTLPGYVPTIVRHCFFNHLRVRSRTNQWEVELDVERHDRGGNGIDLDLRIAVLNLDDDEREMIILCYYNGRTIKEAGRQLGLPESQAYRLHHKALGRA